MRDAAHVKRLRYRVTVQRNTIWTAKKLGTLSPSEQDALFEASVVSDIEKMPPELLARARARIGERIARTESAAR